MRISFRTGQKANNQFLQQTSDNPYRTEGQVKGKSQHASAPQLDSLQMITDEYWEAVMLNTYKDKGDMKRQKDGIQLWNIVYPKTRDYEQASIIVQKLTEKQIGDPLLID